ncbi:hypothetical protein [Peribacillus sp. R9-11]|uniref:hypothetical protein n=1 Tax=Peribacillus sp. R9-11 TaxID=3073271 RepID=UPI0028686239|nr:hypothetical protein [Peribacillus sp. R9-11]WMX53541.1 hypothetical protein RE409_15720 [Peribacillus sp. R9-11]
MTDLYVLIHHLLFGFRKNIVKYEEAFPLAITPSLLSVILLNLAVMINPVFIGIAAGLLLIALIGVPF